MNPVSGKPSVELFAYPWDILDTGVSEFVNQCVDLGVSEIHATTCYHSGKFLLPRNKSSRVYFPEPGCVYFPPSQDAFRGGLTPPVSKIASTGWLDQLAGEAAKRNVRLAAWTVIFHNSTLGRQHPELTIHNLFGDSYGYGLCPSNERVRDYAVDLCKGVVSTGAFSTIDLESIGYNGYSHGFHHEVDAVPVGPLEQFILSLCFCPACETSAREAGIGFDALRATLKRILLQRLACDHASTKDPENAEQVATLLALIPDLRALITLRCATVTKLLARLRDECPGSTFNVFTSSFVGAPSNIWMEGVDFGSAKDLIDRFMLLAYSSDPDVVKTDLLLCLSLAEDPANLSVALNLGLPATPSLANARSIVEFALEQKLTKFAFFNYGFLGAGKLNWLRELAGQINGHA